VRLADADPSGRIRLDALSRYLQDVATDDAAEAGLVDGWILRRLALRIDALPRFRDDLELATWCSGTAASAAERCTTLAAPGEAAVAVSAVALWVFVGPDGRPARLDRSGFTARYGPEVDRKVGTRLRLGDPPPDVTGQPWPLRSSDVDVLRHVNNTVSLVALEDALVGAGLAATPPPWEVEVEYRAAIEPGDAPRLVTAPEGRAAFGAWLVCDGAVRTAMRWAGPGAVAAEPGASP
jgi:acyl-ACP thioesterase